MVFNKRFLAHGAALTANLIYGANYSIAKGIMPYYIKPFGFIVIRVLFTAFVFWTAGIFFKREKLEPSDNLRLFLCAVFGVAINQLLFFKGLDLTAPINGALMMTTNPIMVLIAASMIIRERITANKIMGILLGVSGALTLLLLGKPDLAIKKGMTGDLFILINSLSYGIFLIMVKPLMQRYNTITVMKWLFLYGSMLVLPFGYGEFSEIRWSTFNPSVWWGVAFVVIGTTSLAYMFNTFALRNLSPANVSVYIYLQPFFAVIFALLMGRDHLQILHICAAILIFAGVYLVSFNPSKKLKGKKVNLASN